MSRAYDRAVIFIVKRRRAKIDEVDARVEQHSPELSSTCCKCARRRDVAVVCEGLIGVVEQEDVLGFEICMDEIRVVKKGNGAKQLPSKGLYLRAWKWYKAALLQKVEDAVAKEWCDNADMSSPVEAVVQLDTSIAIVLIGHSESLQHTQLDTRSVAILCSMLVMIRYESVVPGRHTLGTARIIFTATSLRVRRSCARTTFPNVP